MDKYIGRLLDNRYEILEIIGTGGMAVVYKARCHRLNRLVAIKILKDDFMQDEDFRRRFHSESQAVAMLGHPNIVSVYDVSTSIMADYIVMELIEGISLKQYMEKKGCLNWKETLHFGIQIAKALEHAHSRGIVHRDIKPHNIMVLKNGSVKVTDFGIARMMSKGNTLTKEALGSVHYISPEQAKGGRVDNRSDIYSLGIVMYEMMSGRPPYDGESPVAVAIQHINGGAVLPSTYNPNIPGGLEQVIMKAMAHDQSKRYASATEMLRDMDEFRKDPAILFDYNAPQEDLLVVHRATQVLERPVISRTTAERVVQKKEGAEPPLRPVQRDGAVSRPTDSQQRTNRNQNNHNSNNNTAIIAIIACALVALIAVVVFLVIVLSGDDSNGQNPGSSQTEAVKEMVEVPDFRGIDYQDLKNNPDVYDIDLTKFDIIWKWEYSDEYAEGVIMAQDFAPWDEIREGSKITLTVSSGVDPAGTQEPNATTEATEPEETTEATTAPEEILMDDLVEMTEDKARNTLMEYDLQLEIHPEKAFSDTIPAGCVISTRPTTGTPLNKGDKVTLVVSAGKQPRMASYVGKDGKEARDALIALDIDLEVEVQNEYHDTIAAGKVISTDPAEGKFLDFGDKIVVVVSKGVEVVKELIPSQIVGMKLEDAVKLLNSTGFKSYEPQMVESDEPVNTVLGYYVKNEEGMDTSQPVDVKSVIVLKVATAPKNKTLVKSIAAPTTEELAALGISDTEPLTMTILLPDGSVVHSIGITPGETYNLDFEGRGQVTYKININGKFWMNCEVHFG